MTTHENRPASETPDWVPTVGNLCGSCNFSANTCRCLSVYDDKPCCGACSHQVKAEPDVAYYGD